MNLLEANAWNSHLHSSQCPLYLKQFAIQRICCQCRQHVVSMMFLQDLGGGPCSPPDSQPTLARLSPRPWIQSHLTIVNKAHIKRLQSA